MHVLVISPHPDDESIGCGGTIRQHVLAGDVVEVIFLTSGEKGGHGRSAAETAPLREEEARAAGKLLGVSSVEFWRGADGNFSVEEKTVKRLVGKLTDTFTGILYVPHEAEAHPDHRAAATLVRQALLQLPAELQPTVWMYEVWTPLQQIDHIVDISDVVHDKMRAIRAHKSQCDVLRFDEAILGLNRYRGEMHSWPGGDYAEIFKKPDA